MKKGEWLLQRAHSRTRQLMACVLEHEEKENGSPGWDRTNDHPINSRMLYR